MAAGLALAADLPCQYLVKDIETGSRPDPSIGRSYPGPFGAMGGRVYFAAADVGHADSTGRELWVTDGTETGTSLLRDIHRGATVIGLRGSSPERPTVVGNTLFFRAVDDLAGHELWKTDGTTAGTVMVKDIWPGGANHSSPEHLTAVGGLLYFVADDGTHGQELWLSDGTAAGTVMVADLWPGPGGSSPGRLTTAGSLVYFVAGPTGDREVWRSDGTAAGTYRVRDIRVGSSSNPSALAFVGGRLFFAADDGVAGHELWVSDGTEAGTVRVADIRPGAASSVPREIVPFAGGVLFSADDGVAGAELWTSDGSAAGTRLFADVWPGSPASNPRALVAHGGVVYFAAASPASATGTGLFATSGAGPGMLVAATPGSIDAIVPGLARIFFTVSQRSLWTASSPAGAVQLMAFGGVWFDDAAALGDAVLFEADDGTHYHEPWISDGTIGGTRLLKDIGRPAALPSSPGTDPVDLGSVLYFTAGTLANGNELWRSDGTDAGTHIVVDLTPTGTTSPSFLTPWSGAVYFAARLPAASLWRSDGTASGTSAVTGTVGLSVLAVAPAGNRLFFVANDAARGNELWATSGSTANVVELQPGPPSGAGLDLIGLAGGAVFRGAQPGTGAELWFSDGTTASLLRDIYPGATGSSPSQFFAFHGGAYFTATDDVHGHELWFTDGTPAGTRLVRDVRPGLAGSDPGRLVAIGSTLYFLANDGVAGREVWATDGTTAGTRLAIDLLPGPAGSDPMDLRAGGDLLYLVLPVPTTQGTFGLDLWRSDGTLPGTLLLRQFRHAPPFQGVGSLTFAGSRMWFTAKDEWFGSELWTTDGTVAGTQIAADAWPGPMPSYAGGLAESGGRLFFRADDGEHGLELWALPLGATATPAGVGCTCRFPPPRLTASAPRLGGMATIALRGATPNTVGALLLGLPAQPVPLGGDCNVYLQPLGTAGFMLPDVNGAASLPLGIPADANLTGLRLAFQLVLGPTGSPPLGGDLSNALVLVLGP